MTIYSYCISFDIASNHVAIGRYTCISISYLYFYSFHPKFLLIGLGPVARQIGQRIFPQYFLENSIHSDFSLAIENCQAANQNHHQTYHCYVITYIALCIAFLTISYAITYIIGTYQVRYIR